MSVPLPAERWGLYQDQWRRYMFHGTVNGKSVTMGPAPGVTSILKLQDIMIPGDLATWGGGLAADHILENWPRKRIAADLMRTEALGAVTAARDIGSEVHAEIEKILLNQPVAPTERTAPYVYAFSAFLAAERPEFLGVEQRVANLKYRFGGTFDIAGIIRRKVGLLDVKTGRRRESHKLQLAGYSTPGTFIGFDGDPEPHPLPRFRAYYLLYLTPGGYELVEEKVSADDRRHFLALAAMYHRIRAWHDANKETT